MRTRVIGALVLLATVPRAHGQDVEAGTASFRKCAPCHAVGEGKSNGIGPVLNGLDGRRAGTVDGYNYTGANKSAGIVWDEATFKEYIKDPRGRIPGTKMLFAGITSEKEATDLWAYLKQFGPEGRVK